MDTILTTITVPLVGPTCHPLYFPFPIIFFLYSLVQPEFQHIAMATTSQHRPGGHRLPASRSPRRPWRPPPPRRTQPPAATVATASPHRPRQHLPSRPRPRRHAATSQSPRSPEELLHCRCPASSSPAAPRPDPEEQIRERRCRGRWKPRRREGEGDHECDAVHRGRANPPDLEGKLFKLLEEFVSAYKKKKVSIFARNLLLNNSVCSPMVYLHEK